jgi:predicted Zn-dependent protease
LREQLARANTQSILAMLLGVGAMVAADAAVMPIWSGRDGGDHRPQAAIRTRFSAMYARRRIRRTGAAVRFLTETGQSPKGMYDTFKRMADQLLYQARYINPYMQTHPLPSERVAALEGMAKASPYWNAKDSPALQARHDLMRAKLYGFWSGRKWSCADIRRRTQALLRRYARAIAAHRFSETRVALAQTDGLIHSQPQNPYFHELKGQTLLEAGKPSEAIAPCGRRCSSHQTPP